VFKDLRSQIIRFFSVLRKQIMQEPQLISIEIKQR
jgi:hypothetical protein